MTAAYVGVIGSGVPATETDALAEKVGQGVAERGAVLVCGGLGGVMEAACRGARSAGGRTLGILPGSDRGTANPHVELAVATGMGELRNGLIVRAADALIAVGGEWGTLSEIALALKLGKPVVGLRTWPLARAGAPEEAIVVSEDAEQAVERAFELLGR
jgi:uncharacterized protein (TIGR00725 family)